MGLFKTDLSPELKDCHSIENINNFYNSDRISKKIERILNIKEKKEQTIDQLNKLIFSH